MFEYIIKDITTDQTLVGSVTFRSSSGYSKPIAYTNTNSLNQNGYMTMSSCPVGTYSVTASQNTRYFITTQSDINIGYYSYNQPLTIYRKYKYG